MAMGNVGCLGDIAFVVSGDRVLTVQDPQWSGSVRIGEHNRHLYHALTEFQGISADTFSLDILLASYLGVSVMDELVKLWNYERGAVPLPLVLGEKGYGKYRWLIKSHNVKMRSFDKAGNITGATVAISLIEYLNQ